MDAEAKVRAAAEPIFDKLENQVNELEKALDVQTGLLMNSLTVLKVLDTERARELIHRLANLNYEIGNRIASLDQQ